MYVRVSLNNYLKPNTIPETQRTYIGEEPVMRGMQRETEVYLEGGYIDPSLRWLPEPSSLTDNSKKCQGTTLCAPRHGCLVTRGRILYLSGVTNGGVEVWMDGYVTKRGVDVGVELSCVGVVGKLELEMEARGTAT